jgi:hypothetical protein
MVQFDRVVLLCPIHGWMKSEQGIIPKFLANLKISYRMFPSRCTVIMLSRTWIYESHKRFMAGGNEMANHKRFMAGPEEVRWPTTRGSWQVRRKWDDQPQAVHGRSGGSEMTNYTRFMAGQEEVRWPTTSGSWQVRRKWDDESKNSLQDLKPKKMLIKAAKLFGNRPLSMTAEIVNKHKETNLAWPLEHDEGLSECGPKHLTKEQINSRIKHLSLHHWMTHRTTGCTWKSYHM